MKVQKVDFWMSDDADVGACICFEIHFMRSRRRGQYRRWMSEVLDEAAFRGHAFGVRLRGRVLSLRIQLNGAAVRRIAGLDDDVAGQQLMFSVAR